MHRRRKAGLIIASLAFALVLLGGGVAGQPVVALQTVALTCGGVLTQINAGQIVYPTDACYSAALGSSLFVQFTPSAAPPPAGVFGNLAVNSLTVNVDSGPPTTGVVEIIGVQTGGFGIHGALLHNDQRVSLDTPGGFGGALLEISNRSSDEATSIQEGAYIEIGAQDDAGGAVTYYGLGTFATTNPSSNGNYSGAFNGLYASGTLEGTGNVTGSLRGVYASGWNAGSGTATFASGGDFWTWASSTGTINTAKAIRVRNQVDTGPVIGKMGISIDEITDGQNNVDLLVGSTSPTFEPDGSFAIFSASPRQSVYSGPLQIGACIFDGGVLAPLALGNGCACSNCAIANPCVPCDGGSCTGAFAQAHNAAWVCN